jgi:dCMP deaminase
MSDARRWLKHGLAEAALIASMSKDPSTKVGAYIADSRHRPVSKGFNGPPRGLHDGEWVSGDRAKKLAATIHAETNAIIFADRQRLEGATLYVTHPPCPQCAALIAQAGIVRVVYRGGDAAFLSRWGTVGLDLLAEAGVTVIEAPQGENGLH